MADERATNEVSKARPYTIDKLRFAADSAIAMVAGIELDVFTPLKAGPKTAEEIAKAINVNSARLRLLLYALVVAELLTEQNGRFSNTPEANQYLVKGSATYMGHRHATLSSQWVRKLKTAESLRSGVPQAKFDFSNSSSHEIEAFFRRINVNAVQLARVLLERYDFTGVKTLADIGSGCAGIALTIAKATPHMVATAIDLPHVTPITRKVVEEENMTDRVNVMAADVLCGPIPGLYDVAILRNLVQAFAAREACLAIKNIAAALKPQGRIYVVGQILDDCRTSPPDAVGRNLLFINMFDAGEAHTERDHRLWLGQAGFVEIERGGFLLPGGEGVMSARKAK